MLTEQELHKTLSEFEQNLLLKINTCIPCKVVAVNNGRVNVQAVYQGIQIGIGQTIRTEIGEYVQTENYTLPYILDVPICMLVNSVARITLPVNVGDQGLLIISQRDIRNWKQNQGTLASIRKFNINDGFFLPFINQSISNYSNNSLVIQYGSNKLEINNSKLTITGNVEINGTLKVSGETTIKNIPYSTHIHPYTNTPPSTTGVPQ